MVISKLIKKNQYYLNNKLNLLFFKEILYFYIYLFSLELSIVNLLLGLKIFMFTLEISLRYSPFPISIQKKEHDDVLRVFEQIKNAMRGNENSVLIDLSCDKIKSKSIAVLSSEIIAVQIYEKSAIAGGSKRPGFSLES